MKSQPIRDLVITTTTAITAIAITFISLVSPVAAHPASQAAFSLGSGGDSGEALSLDRNVSATTYAELEELARIVDISYCVGTSGIQKPFKCASRCSDAGFEGFELITVCFHFLV